MKQLLLALSLLLISTAVIAEERPEGVSYDIEVIRVVDGDTIEFAAPFLPDPLEKKLSVRIWGVDTPEKGGRADCDKEADLAALASQFTKDKVASAKSIQMSLYDWDKYGGRVLGDVLIDGQSLSAMLISNGYAREYYGDKKESWCN